MHTANENRKQTSKPVRLLAAAVLLVMVGSGYTVSTHVEGAADKVAVVIPAIPPAEQGQDYFPAQFANQVASAADLNQQVTEEIPTF